MNEIEVKNTEDAIVRTDVAKTSDVPPNPFPAPLAQQPQTVPDVNALCPAGPANLQLLGPAQTFTPVQPPKNGPVPVFVSDSQYLLSGGFDQYIANNKKYANRKTGFPNMDAMRPFSPGLYMVMGATSAGKTTFILQWCAQIAARGEYVLFFGLEQSKDFLMSKNLARDYFEEYREDAAKNNGQSSLPIYSSSAIRYGQVDGAELKRRQISYAQKMGNRTYTVPTNFAGNVNDICDYVDKFIEQTGEAPVVVIDYFQLLQALTTPSGYVLDTRTSLDMGIHKLKQYQESKGLTIFVISSLSRQGYAEPISLSHAKESGMLEYTCDVTIAIQMCAIHEKKDAHGKKLNEAQRKEILEKAKSESPRKVEAVFLKDRCGIQNSKVYFDYYPEFETFVPTDDQGNPM